MIPALDKFPRNRRFTLGEKIESRLLTILELLTEAAYNPSKKPLLKKANANLAVIRHLWRLAFELGASAKKSYEYGGRQLVNLGNQIGGWYKSCQQ